MYFIAVFSFGLNGDLAARQSIYPARLFTLPVSSAELARWPMVYGLAAMSMLWVIARIVARWPLGLDLPMAWPGLMMAVVLAWTQVFMWMPYGFRGLRVALAVTVLITLDTLVILAINYKLSETALVAFLAPQLPLAYFCACLVVARARRGVVPDWNVFSRARVARHCEGALAVQIPCRGATVVRVAAQRPIAAGAGRAGAAVRARHAVHHRVRLNSVCLRSVCSPHCSRRS